MARACETEEERKLRLRAVAKQYRLTKARKAEEERELRRKAKAERLRLKRDLKAQRHKEETPEQRQARLERNWHRKNAKIKRCLPSLPPLLSLPPPHSQSPSSAENAQITEINHQTTSLSKNDDDNSKTSMSKSTSTKVIWIIPIEPPQSPDSSTIVLPSESNVVKPSTTCPSTTCPSTIVLPLAANVKPSTTCPSTIVLPLASNVVKPSTTCPSTIVLPSSSNVVQLSTTCPSTIVLPSSSNVVQPSTTCPSTIVLPLASNVVQSSTTCPSTTVLPLTSNVVQSSTTCPSTTVLPLASNVVQSSTTCPSTIVLPSSSNVVQPSTTCPSTIVLPLASNVVQSSTTCPSTTVLPLTSNVVQSSTTCPSTTVLPLASNVVQPSTTCPSTIVLPLASNVVQSSTTCPSTTVLPLASNVVSSIHPSSSMSMFETDEHRLKAQLYQKMEYFQMIHESMKVNNDDSNNNNNVSMEFKEQLDMLTDLLMKNCNDYDDDDNEDRNTSYLSPSMIEQFLSTSLTVDEPGTLRQPILTTLIPSSSPNSPYSAAYRLLFGTGSNQPSSTSTTTLSMKPSMNIVPTTTTIINKPVSTPSTKSSSLIYSAAYRLLFRTGSKNHSSTSTTTLSINPSMNIVPTTAILNKPVSTIINHRPSINPLSIVPPLLSSSKHSKESPKNQIVYDISSDSETEIEEEEEEDNLNSKVVSSKIFCNDETTKKRQQLRSSSRIRNQSKVFSNFSNSMNEPEIIELDD